MESSVAVPLSWLASIGTTLVGAIGVLWWSNSRKEKKLGAEQKNHSEDVKALIKSFMEDKERTTEKLLDVIGKNTEINTKLNHNIERVIDLLK